MYSDKSDFQTMKVSTPKPLQYLVKVSSVSKEFVQELEADE